MKFNPSNGNDLGLEMGKNSYLNEFFSINKRYSNNIKYIILKEVLCPAKYKNNTKCYKLNSETVFFGEWKILTENFMNFIRKNITIRFHVFIGNVKAQT